MTAHMPHSTRVSVIGHDRILGLSVGTEFTVSAFANPVVWKLEDRAQAGAIALFERDSVPLCLSGTRLIFCFSSLKSLVGGTNLSSFCLLLPRAFDVFTVVFLVPINNRMARLSSDSLSETARREHKKWDALHRLRAVAVGVALICFLLRTLLRGSSCSAPCDDRAQV
jgi:hypothetical protein